MKLINILSEAPNIPENLQDSFNNIFTRIQNRIKDETEVNVSPKWLAGFLKQYNDFKHLDQMQTNYRANGNEHAANDVQARIIARDALTKLGLLDQSNGYLPKKKGLLSAMRQYYTTSVHDQNTQQDSAKLTRNAAGLEYEDWYKSLSDTDKNYVDNLQELNPQEWTLFKGIVDAKESKQEFVTRLHQLAQDNEVGHSLIQNMGLITDDNKLDMVTIEKFRTFLSSVTPARLKDVISKSSVYSGKKTIHDKHLAKNAVLKGLEKDPSGKYSLMIKLYHYISSKIVDQQDKEKAFRRIMSKVPLANDAGAINIIGKGAYQLYKMYKGQKLDPTEAIKHLNDRYFYPADRGKRADKASGRGENIKKHTEI